ncbi:hypothetical protein [Streptomyces ficellus]|uniref:Uncharacterized protein n=1 Tax=Streptomyces ficellus TaxID=1977088 RepID=A0A6I6FA08_9ACTN|nr:hypothetical protein [Streptomyces ficellus]QGV79814.1 hypothetical protein EIZ62_17435 [Streptomyces ficellus]
MSLGDEHDGASSTGGGGAGQTRTRLPDSGAGDGYGGVYGGARRPARNSRSLITVVGVVVLLIAAIAFANRSGDGDASSSDAAPDRATAPTAATGVKPVAGKNGTIPSGYARDEQGAQSAAANYAVALGSDGMFKQPTRHDIVRAVHDPAVVEKLLGSLDAAYSGTFLKNVGLNEDGSAPEGLTFVSRTVPVGTKVLEASETGATIEVWCTGLVGLAGEGSTKPVTETWFTITEKLKWVGNDWRIESSSQKEGPTPVNGDNRASTADEIAGAVAGYGGFTYAR